MLEKLSNENLEKLIIGEKLSIRKYDKIPSSLKNILGEINFKIELEKWRKTYDLTKLFH